MADAKKGEGKIDQLAAEEGRLSFKISGKYYKMWAKGEEQAEKDEFVNNILYNFKAGNLVEFTYAEKANPNSSNPYKNILTIKKITALSNATSTALNAVSAGQNSRQVAIRVAAEYLKACPQEINEKAPMDTLVKYAGAIEQWLNGHVTTKETIKGSRGDLENIQAQEDEL